MPATPFDQYLYAIRQHRVFMDALDPKSANEEYRKMMLALKDIRKTPDRGLDFLTRLAKEEGDDVACVAAAHLLPLDEKLAIRTLKKIAKKGTGENSFEAEMVLKEWKAGRMKVE